MKPIVNEILLTSTSSTTYRQLRLIYITCTEYSVFSCYSFAKKIILPRKIILPVSEETFYLPNQSAATENSARQTTLISKLEWPCFVGILIVNGVQYRDELLVNYRFRSTNKVTTEKSEITVSINAFFFRQ